MLGHQRDCKVRQCLILAQAPGATSPQLPLMPKGRQLGPGLVAAGTGVPREEQRKARPAQEALRPHFQHIPKKPPPSETQKHLLAPLPQRPLAEAPCISIQQISLSSPPPHLRGLKASGLSPGETPGWGPRRSMCPKEAPDRRETQGWGTRR